MKNDSKKSLRKLLLLKEGDSKSYCLINSDGQKNTKPPCHLFFNPFSLFFFRVTGREQTRFLSADTSYQKHVLNLQGRSSLQSLWQHIHANWYQGEGTDKDLSPVSNYLSNRVCCLQTAKQKLCLVNYSVNIYIPRSLNKCKRNRSRTLLQKKDTFSSYSV